VFSLSVIYFDEIMHLLRRKFPKKNVLFMGLWLKIRKKIVLSCHSFFSRGPLELLVFEYVSGTV